MGVDIVGDIEVVVDWFGSHGRCTRTVSHGRCTRLEVTGDKLGILVVGTLVVGVGLMK